MAQHKLLTERHAGMLELIGGYTCLDFCNTVSVRGASGREYLNAYADLVRWGVHASVLQPRKARQLLALAEATPAEARRTFKQALAWRETLFRVFASLAARTSPKRADVQVLDAMMCEAQAQRQLTVMSGQLIWQPMNDGLSLVLPLWSVAESAAKLIASPAIHKLKKCANSSECDWLFVDTSKNGSRRWCGMALCGSLNKVRRYYERQQIL